MQSNEQPATRAGFRIFAWSLAVLLGLNACRPVMDVPEGAKPPPPPEVVEPAVPATNAPPVAEVEEPAPAPVLPGGPEPAEPVAEPAARIDPLEWLLANPRYRPAHVALRNAETFSVHDGERRMGSAELRAGAKVELVDLGPETVVVRYAGDVRRLPVEATDIREGAVAAMGKAAADVRIARLRARETAGFVHPGITATRADLDFVKAHLHEEPWKTAFKVLKDDHFSQLAYKPRGPWEVVERFPGKPLRNTEWKQDMTAVYHLSLMWYFTGDEAYARKGRDILVAWAEKQKSFNGWEAMLDLGDQVHRFAGGADILRGTWPGWTEEDTLKVKKLFRDVYLPAAQFENRWLGPANKGALAIVAATGIAVFLDDRKLFDDCLHFLQTHGPSTLPSTLSTGQAAEAGRDLGHNFGQVLSMAQAAEIAWKQGVDIYGDMDNRLLACGEYYARHALGGNPPFITLGTTDALYWGPCSSGWPHGRRCFDLLITAYRFRKGLPTPWLELSRLHAPLDPETIVHYLPEDRSTAAPRPFRSPPLKSVSRDLALSNIGNTKPDGSLVHANGTWTLAGGGEDFWRHGGDSFTFASKPVKGNFTIIARVDGIAGTRDNCKAALMVREKLSPDGIKAVVAVTPAKQAEWFMSGWTAIRGNVNWEKGGRGFPGDFPVWLKLERVNEMIYQCWSPDGASWSTLGAGSFTRLGAEVQVGLAVCSLENGVAATAVFSRVHMTGGDGLVAPTAPEAPLALLASSGAGAVPLRWSMAFGADRYLVQRSSQEEGPFETIATVVAPSYIDHPAEHGRTNFYVVRAANAGGEGPASPVVAAAADEPLVNVTDRGVASSSRREGSDPDWVFDDACETWWESAPDDTNAWVQYDLGAGQAREVVRYGLSVPNDAPAKDPRDWTLEGSDDGTNWTVLDARTSQVFTVRALPENFPVEDSRPCRFHRLRITAGQSGAGQAVQLSELRLLARPLADDPGR